MEYGCCWAAVWQMMIAWFFSVIENGLPALNSGSFVTDRGDTAFDFLNMAANSFITSCD